jgi:hypothetical protein
MNLHLYLYVIGKREGGRKEGRERRRKENKFQESSYSLQLLNTFVN